MSHKGIAIKRPDLFDPFFIGFSGIRPVWGPEGSARRFFSSLAASAAKMDVLEREHPGYGAEQYHQYSLTTQ
jgi:hypothetical protein